MIDIKGYEGLYAITSCGKVWSYRSKKFLEQSNVGGYRQVNLSKDGVKKMCLVHRLVAEAYIPNPDNKPQVSHKDEVRDHNWIGNLEWTTAKENCNYGTHNERLSKSMSKAVYCVELEKQFYGASVAARELGLNQQNISACCNGKRKTCGGYHWHFI